MTIAIISSVTRFDAWWTVGAALRVLSGYFRRWATLLGTDFARIRSATLLCESSATTSNATVLLASGIKAEQVY
jgi:hypothetical protein